MIKIQRPASRRASRREGVGKISRESGATLIEYALALGVFLVILATAFTSFEALTKSKIEKNTLPSAGPCGGVLSATECR